jgi:hypothetical protein
LEENGIGLSELNETKSVGLYDTKESFSGGNNLAAKDLYINHSEHSEIILSIVSHISSMASRATRSSNSFPVPPFPFSKITLLRNNDFEIN